ncbi:MAG TPA: SPFH domain-containing protein [Bacteroidia bacterium]|nr:SPFH domain-containing protein [Bacteroidales bacterium]HRU69420.1 SPFH domain-containing protein [Bacteroidia bacterium]
MNTEKNYRPWSGYLAVLALVLLLAGIIYSAVQEMIWPFLAMMLLFFLVSPGLVVVNPNESRVLVLFGDYRGTIKKNGFFWVNPFFVKKKISLRARNFDSKPIKVNDKVGNPIMIGLVLVWKVEDTYKAAFAVDEYENFVVVQSEAALRKLAGTYPYDNFEDESAEVTLRSAGDAVNHQLEKEIAERLEIAGIHVIEARINYIAYASEIAGAMLRRQQATAVVAARSKIVEGAVGMVEMALNQLAGKKIVDLDEEKKAAMVSNLMVVLCSDESARPVVNAGTLNQ